MEKYRDDGKMRKNKNCHEQQKTWKKQKVSKAYQIWLLVANYYFSFYRAFETCEIC